MPEKQGNNNFKGGHLLGGGTLKICWFSLLKVYLNRFFRKKRLRYTFKKGSHRRCDPPREQGVLWWVILDTMEGQCFSWTLWESYDIIYGDKKYVFYLLWINRKDIEEKFEVGIKYELVGEDVGLVRYLQIIYME